MSMSDVRKLHTYIYRQIELDANNVATASCYVRSIDGERRRMIHKGRMIDGKFVPEGAPEFELIPKNSSLLSFLRERI